MECGDMGATPPASLFEITIGGYNNLDYYDVSFVDGYNLSIIVVPRCDKIDCVEEEGRDEKRRRYVIDEYTDDEAEYYWDDEDYSTDDHKGVFVEEECCLKELQVVGNGGDGGSGAPGGEIACNSACGAFGMDQYCCSGQYICES
ncbi:thaumatin [Artemisia annua]|uniref:Thaumatin n=1 Tax=Artemisia annua TaxID=35608 RepID=A0A2U1MEC5_ARTAN|nr:thaumatin [Artemisia annua]